MGKPCRNARKARAKMKREPMPAFALAFTKRQAAALGLPTLPPRQPPRKVRPRMAGDTKHRRPKRAA